MKQFRNGFSFLLLIGVLSCASAASEQPKPIDYFAPMEMPATLMEFISSTNLLDLNEARMRKLEEMFFNSTNNEKSNDIRVGNSYFEQEEFPNSINWVNNKNKEWLFIQQNSDSKKNEENWDILKKGINRYSGMRRKNGLVYLKLDTTQNSSLNATFYCENAIINYGIELPFVLPGYGKNASDYQQVKFQEAVTLITSRLNALSEILVAPALQLYKPSEKLLSEEVRLFGLMKFWSEVKYNFAFFHQVPNLNWEWELQKYIPKVKAATSNADYFKVMQALCATLEDGHTNVYIPSYLHASYSSPPIKFKNINDTIYVTNIDKKLSAQIPLGAEVIAVDGQKTIDYLENKVNPYISSSTKHILKAIAAKDLLKGEINTEVTITIKAPNQIPRTIKLTRNQKDVKWLKKSINYPISSFEKLENNIAYVGLNTFRRTKIVEQFESYVEEIMQAEALIIDLRNNGGGNSSNGYEILKYFSKKPFLTSKWATREHRPAYKAWGSAYKNKSDDALSDFELKIKNSFLDKHWYFAAPDTIFSDKKQVFDKPVIVLIGSNTESAAEDFLVASSKFANFTTMGSATVGSTGQPLHIKLPGGGAARICTKMDTYPDGKEFVGFGIQPKVAIKETITQLLNEEDEVLAAAIKYLNQKK